MITKKNIIDTINSCIASTRSRKKKKLGLPLLIRDINNIIDNDIHSMITILMIALKEPSPSTSNPRDDECKYWVNRHSTGLFRKTSKKTNTFKKLKKITDKYYSDESYFTRSFNKNNRVIDFVVKKTPPFIIDSKMRITADIVKKMKKASRRADKEIVLLGHGETTLNKRIKIPKGTCVKFYTNDKAFLRNVDVRSIAVPEVWGRYVMADVRETALPGSTIMEHYIGELDPSGIGHRGEPDELGGVWISLHSRPIALSKILVPNMGIVHFAACRAHPHDDMVAFAGGGGVERPGIIDHPLRDSEINRLAAGKKQPF